jgi:uncharacterized protein
MHPAIPRLVDVQEMDHQIASLRTDLERLPGLIRALDAQLAGARTDVASAKEAHTNNLKERKKLELDVQQWKDRAKKYRDQTGAVKTNEAYKALLQEIANAEGQASKAEDLELDVMLKGDEIDRRVRAAEAQLRESEASVALQRKKIEAEGLEKKKLLDAATAKREHLFATIPEDLRDLYTRIAKRHNGTALARVRDDQCMGCGLRVLPHIVQLLHRDDNEEVHRCENCGLILYTLEPASAHSPAASGNAEAASSSS